MWHILGISAEKFFLRLLQIDRQLAEMTRERGCCCGGRLHRSDYDRKPRGVPDDCEVYVARRFSFCCARSGCRQRATPPSVRFMGRRVYAAAVVVLTCAGWSDVEVDEVPAWTRRRWRAYFARELVKTSRWRDIRARLDIPVDESRLPASLLERLQGDRCKVLISGLQLLLLGPMMDG